MNAISGWIGRRRCSRRSDSCIGRAGAIHGYYVAKEWVEKRKGRILMMGADVYRERVFERAKEKAAPESTHKRMMRHEMMGSWRAFRGREAVRALPDGSGKSWFHP